MNLFDKFQAGLPYDDFLTRFANPGQKERWRKFYEQVNLTGEQRALLGSFRREMNVLCLAGAWCGDCINQCPIFEHFASAAAVIRVRYLDRDEHPDAQDALQINGGNRVPVVVFFSEDGYEVARYGERTLAAYRRLAAEIAGQVLGSGIVTAGSAELLGVVQDWLDEVERVQWVLRLSPPLRRLHGD